MSVESTLPKLKSNVKKVRLPASAADAKTTKPKAEKAPAKKVDAKATKGAKAATTAKAAPAKGKSNAKAVAAPKKEVAAKSAKSAKKGAALTNEGVAGAIANAVASGKASAAGKVDYASSESVLEALTSKAAGVLLKAYSDKAIAAVTHGDADIAKSIKEVITKNAGVVRANAVVKHAKKMAPAIVKAAKAADAGKLTAADFRGIVFAI